MARRKAQRIPKDAKGLAIRKGGCRVVEGNIKICVSKTGVVSMTPNKRGPSKRKAGPKRKPAAKKKATRGKARCVTPPFKMRTKKGSVRCACGVKTKTGSTRPQFLPMGDPRCSGGLPGPMSWKSFVAKGKPARPVPGGWKKVSGIGRPKRRRPVRRRRRY